MQDPRRIAVTIDACPEGSPSAEVDEGDQVITITAHTDGSYVGDCSSGVKVELAERQLVDGSAGDAFGLDQ